MTWAILIWSAVALGLWFLFLWMAESALLASIPRLLVR